MCVIRQTQQILKHSNESIIPKQSYSPNVVRKENLGPVPIKRLSRFSIMDFSLKPQPIIFLKQEFFRGNQGITRHRLFFSSSSFFFFYASPQNLPIVATISK